MSTYQKAAIALLALALGGCNAQQLARVARSDHPELAARELLRERGAAWQANPGLLVQDARTAQRTFEQMLRLFREDVRRAWGGDEVETPSRTRYVKYTDNYLSRAIVDFDAGVVKVETLDQARTASSLHAAIVTTLLTPDDPRAVDLYSASSIELGGRPYLYGLVRDHRNRAMGSAPEADAYATRLVQKQRRERTVQTDSGAKRVSYVSMAMAPNHLNQRAARYAPYVDRYAREFRVSRSLIYAVMQTESSFNPFAVSPASAYGLMQLVPTSGGRDAYQFVKGVDRVPTKEYLFDPQSNIELGTAYLNMLDYRYLGEIRNPLSREYAVIAAYNGGAGGLLNVFDRDRKRAVQVINAMPPSEVYRVITTRHPRAETRRYLVKVLDARKAYVNI